LTNAETLAGKRVKWMDPVIWDDQVQVRILEMRPVKAGYPKLDPGRILWDGINLAEAVRRWLELPAGDQVLVTIFGKQIFVGPEIADLASREDFLALVDESKARPPTAARKGTVDSFRPSATPKAPKAAEAALTTTVFSTDPLAQQASHLHSAVARAFSYLIDATPEEAFFAVFGHWGRGKSFIARTIGKDRALTHKTVFFSSWRYPHAPECWAFLHETILDEVRKSGTFGFVATVLRRNVMRNGIWPAVAADASAFLVIIGLVKLLELYAETIWLISTERRLKTRLALR
jgi:hypothetical protein